MEERVQERYERLVEILRDLGSVVVGFSGGVDSSLLLKVAYDTLGDRVLAVAGLSASYPAQEAEEARRLAQKIGAPWMEVETGEMQNIDYLQNPPDRCFHCKSDLFGKLSAVANERGYNAVVDGCNADDLADYRPGMVAGRKLGVRSPLQEAGLNKADIRALSKDLGLPTWDKPAMACLASRIPYGDMITPEKLSRVNKAEQFLRQRGFRQVRVRCHEDIARIEVPSDDLLGLVERGTRQSIAEYFRDIGFTYVTVDLQGYRSGSMNDALSGTQVEGAENGCRSATTAP